EPRRAEPRRDRDDEPSAFGALPRSDSEERRSEGNGEVEDRPRGRRRRGRRGGRGRGGRDRREEGRAEGREEGREGLAAADRSEPLNRGPRDERDEFPDRDDSFDRASDDLIAEPVRSAEASDREQAGDRDEAGRPRRRRGRRGGRGRGSREGQPSDAVDPSAAPADRLADIRDEPRRSADGDDGGDDEPLPAGYGVRPAASRPAEPRSGQGQGSESRGRRRRGRRGGSGSGDGSRDGSRPATGESGGESSRRRGRRSQRRRSGDERSSSSSSLSRGRRDDFVPVSRGYDEDDEGLEFLGVEEASREAGPRREPRRGDEDDVLAESGLSSVLDVPSWVEAIGIVIASNLDARSRPKSDRSEEDRSRRR
ncbi:MAG: hypothetical protein ACK48M_02385, partial [Planctomycetia bacterium]